MVCQSRKPGLIWLKETEVPKDRFARGMPFGLGAAPAAFEHFNEVHPHSSVKMKAPREFRRLRVEQLRYAQPEQPALHGV